MSSTISKEFVDKKLSTLPIVPSEWDVGRGHYYQLDLRMCQIQRIKWGFNWGDESKPLPRIATITEQPSRILKADFSLNELQNLDYEALYPLKHLRVLDASLNRIQRFESIEVLSHLQTLNLSHNFIKRLDGLERSYNLIELNLGMNEIEDISMMPTLTNLTVLYLNNNKLKSLDGVQGLARLRELYVQRNQIVDLVPLLSSRNLIILNAADNHISALQTTGEVLRHLHKLQSITLHGNPIERENLYQAAILDASQVMVLDNISVRNPPRIEADGPYTDSMQGLKGAATQAFHDQIKAKRQQMEENVSFLQQRIKSLQDEFYAYEEKMKNDMEACLGYLDKVSSEESKNFDGHYFRESLASPQPKPWDQDWARQRRDTDLYPIPPLQPAREKPNYAGITNPDEILRLATTELSKQQAKLNQF